MQQPLSNIVLQNENFPKQFDFWPKSCRTKNNWGFSCREVIPGQRPVAQHGEFRSVFDNGEAQRVFRPDANLYSVQQTRPMQGRKYALQRFVNLFYRSARKDSFVVQQDGKYSTRVGLAAQDIKNHFNNPHKTLHLKSDGYGQWVRIDLDCHEGIDEPKVFIERAMKLLAVCHGNGWHQEVNDPHITGIYFTKFFAKRHDLADVHAYAESLLAKAGLADQHIEVYPQREHSCRCPGDPNRLLILDRIIEPTTHRKQRSTDVEYYLRWLEDRDRQYMAPDRILSYLRMNIPALWDWKPATKSAPRIGSGTNNSHFTSFRGRTWQLVTDFWSGRHCPVGPLDEILPVTVRVAQSQGYNDEAISKGLRFLCGQLPDNARGCSSRLQKTPTARRRLHRDIARKVKHMSGGAGQRKPAQSREILSRCKWRGDIFDPSTWQHKSVYNFQDGSFRLTADQLTEIGTDVVSAFPKKYRSLVNKRLGDIVAAMGKLAALKSKEENGIVYSYWQKFFLSQFSLDLKLTNLKKVLKAARKLGIITLISKLGRSNVYQAGPLFPSSYGSILLAVKKGRPDGRALREMERELERLWGQKGGVEEIS